MCDVYYLSVTRKATKKSRLRDPRGAFSDEGDKHIQNNHTC